MPPEMTSDHIDAAAATAATNIVEQASNPAATTAAEIDASAQALGLPGTMPTAETAQTDASSSQPQSGPGAIRAINSAEAPVAAEAPGTVVAPSNLAPSVSPATEVVDASAGQTTEGGEMPVTSPAMGNPELEKVMNETYGDTDTKTVEGAAVLPPTPPAPPTQAEVFKAQDAAHAAGATWPEIQTPAAHAAGPAETTPTTNTETVPPPSTTTTTVQSSTPETMMTTPTSPSSTETTAPPTTITTPTPIPTVTATPTPTLPPQN